ncbi:ribbon-helix-helix protein, CopG family [Anabaenopsis tanganyikae CS-531]|uniref:Ribbon-helix-helix protein, CopG family n=2 Tax=Anabaenopsis TaxID=110103 RepID=A0ABT6KGR8_9CYAN|nr:MULTISPECIES: ribbon-helix-helix protein, CopG family [Anabaenopsis]MDB9538812.1 ribbon-helix-helix protein, CopG family [Anabaenopsis arnoldii]MDH6091090.1 ribbon-helix-helix protein, CopG family [Anabaenopsis arnoldii]MDH6106913.1 ribbon-helix-helix protein, CopG family [Anabaenopsis tanganyikae CS-531]
MSTGKGKKRVRNTPVFYDEVKKHRGIMLTDTAWHSVQELAAREGVSASEYVECLIRKYVLTEA